MSHFGEIAVIHKTDDEMLSVDWRIEDVLSLPVSSEEYYDSNYFSISGDDNLMRWYFRLRPRKTKKRSWEERFALSLRRCFTDDIAFNVKVGIRSLEVVWRGEVEWRGDYYEDYYNWGSFCLRSELIEPGLLTNNGTLIITCLINKVFPAEDLLSYPILSNADFMLKQVILHLRNVGINETAVVFEHGSDYDDESDDDDDDDDDDSDSDSESSEEETDNISFKKEMNSKLQTQEKNTRKISLPARHENVILSLKAILSGGKRADFTLKSGDREWPVHRAILEGRSGHFENLLRGEWKERDDVRLDDFAEDALEGVLNFVYAGEVADMRVENVCGIYAAARGFLLEDLESLCVKYIKERMCPEMVCGALAIAKAYGEGNLKESALECYFRESERVVATEGWRELKENHPAIIGELFEELIQRERKTQRKE